jgi:glutamate decarboxylase
MVLAQYYMFCRLGKGGYRVVMEAMQANADHLAKRIEKIGGFNMVAKGDVTLPLVAFNLAEERSYDEFDIAFQLSAERGWMVPAYTMPPNAEKVKMMRALVKLTLTRSLVETLADDIGHAIETLEKKGPATKRERKRVKTGTGY